MINQPKPMNELDDELCNYCPLASVGPVNTSWHNLCEGISCNEAYENYLEEFELLEEETFLEYLKEPRKVNDICKKFGIDRRQFRMKREAFNKLHDPHDRPEYIAELPALGVVLTIDNDLIDKSIAHEFKAPITQIKRLSRTVKNRKSKDNLQLILGDKVIEILENLNE